MSSVENFCNALARSRLLDANAIRDLRKRWLQIAGARAGDLDRFRRWLTDSEGLTEYQINAVERGNADQLRLGPYTIEERIGKGRMAGVYRAKHHTGQTVAIKILPPSKARDPQILARFQREARLTLRLKHPNIVRAFQTGQINGLHFLVMEHLEGEPLDEVLARRGPLPPAEAVRLVHQVLMGLDELHEKGLIHRDIKPGNLMLLGGSPDSTERATIKILDIGTGRALFDDPSTELTNEDDLLGTPEYMAPEQARDPHGADIRADIYSVGCVLYHALAGQSPFRDSNRVRLLVRHATETPQPVRTHNPAVPDGLQQILDWMLAKDPAKRYPTPQRAAQALQVFLAAEESSEPVEMDSSMQAYLGYLAREEPEDSINVELVAIAMPVKAPPGKQAAVPVAAPVRAPRPAPPVAAAPPRPARPTARAAPPPPPRPTQPARAEEEEDEEEQESTLFGLSRRDFLMLLVGVGGLAVAVSLGMAIYAVFSHARRSRNGEDAPEREEDGQH